MPATTTTKPDLTARLINGVLAIKPLGNLIKSKARTMMIERAETIGVYWRQDVEALRSRQTETPFSPDWEADLVEVTNPTLQYPAYYTTSFHAYDEGNLGWTPAMEVEVAAQAVHARIWDGAGAEGDARLRQSYHNVLNAQLPQPPQNIVDLGCSVGMSTFTLGQTFPQAKLTGVDLSPYFLAVARYRDRTLNSTHSPVTWVHAAAEATELPDASFDLVSACLMFHELPRHAAIAILQEARRLLRPGGHFAIMDMNPQSEVFAKMPAFVLTLLKSTEPYLDQYFSVDFTTELPAAGFAPPTITYNSPRHRTIIAQAI
jgi:ubiquinone/menaquinone biosynthesis C-methylase UbiE